MSIQVVGDTEVINSKLITFSDGAVNVWIDPAALSNIKNHIFFTIIPDTPVGSYTHIMHLAADIFNKYIDFVKHDVVVSLNLPYLPNARADRAFEAGMSIPLEVTLNNIPSVFSNLLVSDAHNLQAVEELKGDRSMEVTEMSQLACFKSERYRNKKLQQLLLDGTLCAPDKGASEKIKTISDYFGKPYVQLEKNRNPSNGYITGIEIVNNVLIEGRDIVIVDDICDGGMTFILAAEELKKRGAKSVSLYVTHGIFSKGIDKFRGMVDNIFCYQIVMEYVTREQINKFNKGE